MTTAQNIATIAGIDASQIVAYTRRGADHEFVAAIVTDDDSIFRVIMVNEDYPAARVMVSVSAHSLGSHPTADAVTTRLHAALDMPEFRNHFA